MLKVSDLSFSRGNKNIFNSVNFQVKPGEMVALVGKNGEGKSTLVDVVSGILKGKGKEISYNGKCLEEFKFKELSGVRALLGQSSYFPFDISVYEFLMLSKGASRKLNQDDFPAIDEIVELFEIEQFLNRTINSLSGGEQQRVLLAKTVLQLYPFREDRAGYLFLDEPMSALDLEVQQKTMKVLKMLISKYNLGILIVIHDLNQASLYCDRVLILSQGNIKVDDTPKNAITTCNITSYFNLDVKISMIENKPIIIY